MTRVNRRLCPRLLLFSRPVPPGGPTGLKKKNCDWFDPPRTARLRRKFAPSSQAARRWTLRRPPAQAPQAQGVMAKPLMARVSSRRLTWSRTVLAFPRSRRRSSSTGRRRTASKSRCGARARRSVPNTCFTTGHLSLRGCHTMGTSSRGRSRTLSRVSRTRPGTTSRGASAGTVTGFPSSTRLTRNSTSRPRKTCLRWVSTSTTPSAGPL